MNSWVFITLMIVASFMIGWIMANDAVVQANHGYIPNRIQDDIDFQYKSNIHLDSETQAQGEYSMDTTKGDTLPQSADIIQIVNWGFNPFKQPVAQDIFSEYIFLAFNLFKALMYGYTFLWIFMVLKNKKNT